MSYAKITLSGVTVTFDPDVERIVSPIPNVLHPINANYVGSQQTVGGFEMGEYFSSSLDFHTYEVGVKFPNPLSYAVSYWSDGLKLTVLGVTKNTAYGYLQFNEIFYSTSETPTLTFTNILGEGEGTATVEIINDPIPTFTDERSQFYAPDLAWGWDGYVWRWLQTTDTPYAGMLAAGGGRYHQSVVAIAQGQVYYGNIT